MLKRSLACALLIALVLPLSVAAQQAPATEKKSAPIHEVDAKALDWTSLTVPGFAPGLELAALHGDPSQPNQPYTLRLRFPDGYAFPAHFHPMAENLTVLSGTFYLGHGDRADDSALQRYIPGDFLNIPAKMPHYGRVRGETVVQLHGVGPFDIMLSQPAAAAKPKE